MCLCVLCRLRMFHEQKHEKRRKIPLLYIKGELVEKVWGCQGWLISFRHTRLTFHLRVLAVECLCRFQIELPLANGVFDFNSCWIGWESCPGQSVRNHRRSSESFHTFRCDPDVSPTWPTQQKRKSERYDRGLGVVGHIGQCCFLVYFKTIWWWPQTVQIKTTYVWQPLPHTKVKKKKKYTSFF